jgi:hypothetical protein
VFILAILETIRFASSIDRHRLARDEAYRLAIVDRLGKPFRRRD